MTCRIASNGATMAGRMCVCCLAAGALVGITTMMVGCDKDSSSSKTSTSKTVETPTEKTKTTTTTEKKVETERKNP